jgi:hypothetical protein
MYPTSISPKPELISIYIVAIWVGQIGYCVLLVIASKHETKVSVVYFFLSQCRIYLLVEDYRERSRPRPCIIQLADGAMGNFLGAYYLSVVSQRDFSSTILGF